MAGSTYVAYSEAISAQTEVDIIANNVANVNTAGLRRDQTVFDTIMAENMAFSGVSAGQLDLSPGTHQLTKNPLNATIDGEGFFVVKDTEGATFYTRRSDFRINGKRELVLPNGLPVQRSSGTLSIPSGTAPKLLSDGTLTSDQGPLGKLRLITFDDPAQLSKVGGSLIAAVPDAGSFGLAQQMLHALESRA